ncbi:glycoprotein-N-acetylgalactosamine 3-beta-galactosyltransferase 1-like [Lineus longissimus]|uniref:glycoprotein-N-acetylgalactosamine 3-beta-galactosyltransferase 1-like n=1 Tax=Lineus longissimus TaxID=88925 RepID=UPI002B4EB1CC
MPRPRNFFMNFTLLLIFLLALSVLRLVHWKFELLIKKTRHFEPADDGFRRFTTPRVVCWIPAQAADLEEMGETIRATWGKKCDKLIFMSSVNNERFGAVKIDVPYDNSIFLTQKCVKSLLYLYRHHLDEGDWFLKADIDTYFIVENLHYLLSFYSPDVPWMTGHHLRVPKAGMGKGYFSGGAGYVMSRAALEKFVEVGLAGGKCRFDDKLFIQEDLYLGLCMRNISVKFASSYDVTNRETFHTMPFVDEFRGFKSSWLDRYHSHKRDVKCCSPYSISFHRLKTPTQMLEMHAMLYFLNVWGGGETRSWFRPREMDIDDI